VWRNTREREREKNGILTKENQRFFALDFSLLTEEQMSGFVEACVSTNSKK
jgi:hypothetical protein